VSDATVTGGSGYTCRRAAGPITVDGRLDEADWQRSTPTERFGDAATGAVAFFDTRASLLWDDTYLYVGFWLEEHDVWSTGDARRGLVWAENTAEVFLAGPGAHYQLSVNPRGQTEELFFIWKDAYRRGGRYDVPEFDLAAHKPMVQGGDMGPHHPRGMRWVFDAWSLPGLQVAVHVDGAIGQRHQIDRGWTVEIALPWEGLSRLVEPSPPTSVQPLQVALGRNEVIDQRGTRHTALWSWPAVGESGLYTPEQYCDLQLAEPS